MWEAPDVPCDAACPSIALPTENVTSPADPQVVIHRSRRTLVVAALVLSVGVLLATVGAARDRAGPRFSVSGWIFCAPPIALLEIETDSPVEISLPLRGDGVLLPVPTNDALILIGRAKSYQEFEGDAGRLLVAIPLAPRRTGSLNVKIRAAESAKDAELIPACGPLASER